MDGEFETDEVGEDRGSALLGFDRGGVWGRGHLAGEGKTIIVYQLALHFLSIFVYSSEIEGEVKEGQCRPGNGNRNGQKHTAQCSAL